MANINYDLLSTAIEDKWIPTYQAESILSLFAAVPIPNGIATTEWAQQYLIETVKAAWTEAGFKPNTISMDFQGYTLKPTSISQKMELSEKDQAFYAQHGILPEGVNDLAKNVAYSANTAFFIGKGGNGEDAPFELFNFLSDVGASNGTAARPNMFYNTGHTAGGWNTEANFVTDVCAIIGACVAKGFKKENLVIMYPAIAESVFLTKMGTYSDISRKQYILNQGVKDVIPIPDAYMKTTAGAAPTAALFDMRAVELSKVVIGYERAETVTQGKGAFPDRNYYVEGEVWFCPLFIPTRLNEAGTVKTYKGVGQVTAIAMAA